jgi:hypothetical protein
MAFLSLLWLPILVSTVLVFVLSALTHMLVPYRQTEWAHADQEGTLQEAFRAAKPGLYAFPMPATVRERQTPEAMKRWAEGPSGWLSLVPRGPMNMGRNLGLSLLTNLVVSGFVAYIAAHALPAAPHYRSAFRLVGSVAFLAYAVGPIYEAIWYWRPWRSLAMTAADALLFGLVMGGTFGGLWPR